MLTLKQMLLMKFTSGLFGIFFVAIASFRLSVDTILLSVSDFLFAFETLLSALTSLVVLLACDFFGLTNRTALLRLLFAAFARV